MAVDNHPVIGILAAQTWMNSNAIKLALALLWLVPGVAVLAFDIFEQQIHWLIIGALRIPLMAPFVAFGALNLARWYLGRSNADRSPRSTLDRRLHRVRRVGVKSEYNPTFHFDDTPLDHGDD